MPGVKSIALTLADDDAGALALEALASLDALMASPLSCAEGGPMLVGTLALAPRILWCRRWLSG